MTDKDYIYSKDKETGKIDKPVARQRVEKYSRVMGYFRPLSYYNIGKKQEFADRKNFKEPKNGT